MAFTRRPIVLAMLALLLAPWLPGAGVARGEEAAAVATALVASLGATREGARGLPPRPAAIQGAQAGFEDVLRRLESSAQRLEARLHAGASVEETLPLVRRIRTLAREAETSARRANLSDVEIASFASSRALVARLGPLYDGGTLPAALGSAP